MNRSVSILAGILVFAVILVLPNWAFIVTEKDQVCIKRFKAFVGEPITEPGLYFRQIPFIDQVFRFDKRWLEWDGSRSQIPTRDKKYISVDTYARWRIADPKLYNVTVVDESGAQSRLDDIIDGATRDAIASANLIDVVRSSNRAFEISEDLKDIAGIQEIEKVTSGRAAIEQEIREKSAIKVSEYGIELVDVRFKRLDYDRSVAQKVYDRMISERQRIAARYRSEGQQAQAEVLGQKERELRKIRSEAFRDAETIRGNADAKATKIYADAYSKDPEFYAFVKTLETWKATIDQNTQIIMTTDADFLKYLSRVKGR